MKVVSAHKGITAVRTTVTGHEAHSSQIHRGVSAVMVATPDGRLARYKIVDPSFHNWMGVALALRDQQISDFPLCNKSFNLSYCGHDL